MRFTTTIAVGLVMLMFASLTMVTAQDTNEEYCNGIELNSSETNMSVENTTVELEGVYCASTGGYSLGNISMTEENQTAEIEIPINSPGEDEMVTQVITPVEYEYSTNISEDTEEVIYQVTLNGEIVETNEQTGLIDSFLNWLYSIF